MWTSNNKDTITDFIKGEDVIDFSKIEEIESLNSLDVSYDKESDVTTISTANDNDDFEIGIDGLINFDEGDFNF